jgi:fructose-1,6-bisphosphatase
MDEIELTQTRHLAVGDTLVSASGAMYEVTRLLRVGRGIRVHYVTADGRAGRFTAAPEAVSRVRRQYAAAS